MTGRPLNSSDADKQWAPWTPTEIAQRLADVEAPWCITAGWALHLFTEAAARDHSDLEIAVPHHRFNEIAAALPGFAWDVVGDGRVWPFPELLTEHFQTWLRDPATDEYRLDVFREPAVDGRWVCRRDTSITLPYTDLIQHTVDGIPYAIPEVALLFKAKRVRPKDQVDFDNVVPQLNRSRRQRLRDWLLQVHPGHPWISRL